jgi:hypothetical protein
LFKKNSVLEFDEYDGDAAHAAVIFSAASARFPSGPAAREG